MLQLSPVQSLQDFQNASEVRNLVRLKGYFKGSSNLWNHVLDSVIHHDIALCSLGGLIGHLSRLMVSLLVCLFLKGKNKKNVLPICVVYRHVLITVR